MDAQGLAVVWSLDKGVAWSVCLPGYGQPVPVVWGGHVYVTAIDRDDKAWCFVRGLDAETGKQVWEHKFVAAVHTKNSYLVSRAAPTPVVDRDGVSTLFARELGSPIGYKRSAPIYEWTCETRQLGIADGRHVDLSVCELGIHLPDSCCRIRILP